MSNSLAALVFFCAERRRVNCFRCKVTWECVAISVAFARGDEAYLLERSSSGEFVVVPAQRAIAWRLAHCETPLRAFSRKIVGIDSIQFTEACNAVANTITKSLSLNEEDALTLQPTATSEVSAFVADILQRTGVLTSAPLSTFHPDVWLQEWKLLSHLPDLSFGTGVSLASRQSVTPLSPSHPTLTTLWADVVATLHNITAQSPSLAQEQLHVTIPVSPVPLSHSAPLVSPAAATTARTPTAASPASSQQLSSKPKRSPFKALSPSALWSSLKKTLSRPPTHSRTPTGKRPTPSSLRRESVVIDVVIAGDTTSDCKENAAPSRHTATSSVSAGSAGSSGLRQQDVATPQSAGQFNAKRALFGSGATTASPSIPSSPPIRTAYTAQLMANPAAPVECAETVECGVPQPLQPIVSLGDVTDLEFDEFKTSKGGFAAIVNMGKPTVTTAAPVGEPAASVTDHTMTPNAVDRYAVNRRLSVRHTPPEERLERALRAEKLRLMKEKFAMGKVSEGGDSDDEGDADAENRENIAPVAVKKSGGVTRLSVHVGSQPVTRSSQALRPSVAAVNAGNVRRSARLGNTAAVTANRRASVVLGSKAGVCL